MHRIAGLFATGLVALVTVAATGSPTRAATGNSAVVVHDQEPPCLNPLRSSCAPISSTEMVADLALAGAFRMRPDATYEPMLVDRVDVQREPFTLTYHVREEALWSDGTPVTADDFLFTLGAIRDPQNTIFDRAGYDLVTEATTVDSKTFRIRFSRGYGPWRTLFPHVLPRHVLVGHDLDQVWQDEIAHPVTHVPIGSGPFLVTGWTKGFSVTASRNPRWWGARGPALDSIVFRFVFDTNARFSGFRNGDFDVMFPQPQLQIADARTDPRIAVLASRSRALEHLDFNVGSTTTPLLREQWFRQAVAHAIDREVVAANLYAPLVPGWGAHHSLLTIAGNLPSFERYGYDPAAVAAIMTGHGCILGADGIWSCNGVRASVRVATTLGNALREQAQNDMAAQARAAGIELVANYATGGNLFGIILPTRQYDLIMFTFLLPDDTAGGAVGKYGCAGVQNFMGYCSPVVTQLLADAEREVDPVVRGQLVAEADRLLAEDVPSIPLYARPEFLLHRRSLSGPAVNTFGGPVWNVEEWHLGAEDTTPPTTAAQATPAATAHGWHNGPVTVELRADDGAGSGIHAVRYSLSGAQSGSASVPGNAATVTVTADGVTTLTYFARDRFGNVESPRTLTIRIDRVAPTVACAAAPATLWPPSRKLVPVQVDVDVSDGFSGVDGFTLVSLAGGEAGDVDGFDVGAPDTAGSLRAERSQGQERRYVLTYEGADRAGNTARCAAEVAVRRDG